MGRHQKQLRKGLRERAEAAAAEEAEDKVSDPMTAECGGQGVGLSASPKPCLQNVEAEGWLGTATRSGVEESAVQTQSQDGRGSAN